MKALLPRALRLAALLLALAPASGRAAAGLCADQTVTVSTGTAALSFQSTRYGYSGTAVPVSYAYPAYIPGASWVWSEEPQPVSHLATGDEVTFWTTFALPARLAAAPSGSIRITADDGYTIFVNGARIGDSGYPYPSHDDINAPGDWQWHNVKTFDVSAALRPGENVLRLDAWNGAWGPAYATFNPAGLLFQLSVAYAPCQEIAIDVKPGSYPNAINLGSGGTVPVALLSAPGFDAATVDPLTVTLASAQVGLRGKGSPMASLADVNGDGLADLVVHVSTEALRLSPADAEALLEAATFDGLALRGRDTVQIVP